jgi:hypothetical protein
MTLQESFEIFFRESPKAKTFRMQVEIIYKSEQVMRFKVSGGRRSILMEKLLTKKTRQWKIIEADIDPGKSIEKMAYSLMCIQNEIDEYLKKNY